MHFTWITARIKAKRALANFWYWLMKPIAYFFTSEKEKARYEKKKAKITQEMAIRWIAEDIARYIVKHKARYKNGGTMRLIIAESMCHDDISGCECINRFRGNVLVRKKTKMAYWKFTIDHEFQEAVVDMIRTYKGFVVEEKPQKFTWEYVLNYKTTYKVTYEG